MPDRIGPPPGSIAVVRALAGIGDLLCSVPFLRGLRRAYPHARLTLVGLPEAAWFVERFARYVDDLLPFPGFPGIPEREHDHERLIETLRESRARRFDLVVQAHGSGVASNVFASLLASDRIAGFYLPGLYQPDPERFMPYPSAGSEVRRLLELLTFLGVQPDGDHLEWEVADADRRRLASLPEAAALARGSYVVLHPGARDPRRRWAPASFAEVGDALAATGLRVVVTGTAEEASVVREVCEAMSKPARSLVGKTSLPVMAALLEGARLLVCNDTGVSHLAAALRVPSVVVFLHSDPERWAPLDAERHRAVGAALVDHPFPEVPIEHLCLRDGCRRRGELRAPIAEADAVLEEARALLASHAGEPPRAAGRG